MHFIISGLTAAGKTTHARLLADYVGYALFSSGAVLAEIVGTSQIQWSEDLDKARRDSLESDRELDKRVIQRFRDSEPCIFDAWALPWMVPDNAVRIWIESDRPSRNRKCIVSAMMRNRSIEAHRCEGIVQEKDDFSRERFRELHGFDLYRDHSIFDWIIDNSSLIPEPTIMCAKKGIAEFAKVLEIIADMHVHGYPEDVPASLQPLVIRYPERPR